MNLEKQLYQEEEAPFSTQNLLDRLIFAVSDLIIVHTRESKNLMKTFYGVDESRLLVIPHGSFENPILPRQREL